MPKKHRETGFDLLFLTGIWLLAIMLVNPIGDFPLNDDFSYGRSVQNLVEGGELRLDSWLSMTLLAQVLWGAGFCKLFGFSFTVLRISTLALGCIGLAATYLLCRDMGQSRRISVMAGLVMAFNPLFFSLSFTFMTDVPFCSFSLLSMLFYGKYFRENALRWLVLGTFFAIAATFVRQLGLMLPFSFGVACLAWSGLRPKSLVTALAPLLLTLFLFFGYSGWLEASQGLPEGYGDFRRLAGRFGSDGFFKNMALRTGLLLVYLGAFLLPLTLLVLPIQRLGFLDKKNRLAALACAVVIATVAVALQHIPWANIIYNFGTGPKLLKDGFFYLNISPVAPQWVVNCLKIIGLAGTLGAVVVLVKNLGSKFLSENPHRALAVFSLVNLVLYGGFLMLDLHFFDRYFFQMVPFLFPLLLPLGLVFISKKRVAMAVCTLAIMAIFSIATTHDYLAWNRARWQALDHLTQEKKITPDRIDGGFEFNGWHRPTQLTHQGGGKSWWWVKDDEYVVAFGELGGYHKELAFPWVRWLPPGVDSIFILKR